MALFGKDDAMGGYIQTVVSLVLPGGDTGCPDFWSGFMGAVGRNHE